MNDSDAEKIRLQVYEKLYPIFQNGKIDTSGDRVTYKMAENAKQLFMEASKDFEPGIFIHAVFSFVSQKALHPDSDMEEFNSCKDKNTFPGMVHYTARKETKDRLEVLMNAGSLAGSLPDSIMGMVYDIFEDEYYYRIKGNEYAFPDFNNIPKADLGDKEAPVFLMREPVFENSNGESEMFPTMIPVYMKCMHAWENAKRTLEHLGAKVTVMPDTHFDSRRQSYTRDPLIISPNGKVFIPSMELEKSQNGDVSAEQDCMETMLKSLGFKNFERIPTGVMGGDVIFDTKQPEVAFVGGAEHEATVKILSLNEDVNFFPVPMGIRKEHRKEFYHLDLAMSILPGGEVLVCEDVLDDIAVEKIECLEKEGRDVVPVGLKTAQNGALNIVCVGDTLVMPFCSRNLELEIEDLGYKVLTPEKLGTRRGSFMYGKGGPRCSTLEVPESALQVIAGNAPKPDEERLQLLFIKKSEVSGEFAALYESDPGLFNR